MVQIDSRFLLHNSRDAPTGGLYLIVSHYLITLPQLFPTTSTMLWAHLLQKLNF